MFVFKQDELMTSPKRIIFYFIVFIFLNACKEEGYEKITSNNKPINVDGFVGSNTCVNCHKGQFSNWKGSHHDLAMQVANDSTVLGDFNNVNEIIDGVTYLFFKKNEKFFVKILEIDASEITYKIDYTFGVTPLQQYLIDFDK